MHKFEKLEVWQLAIEYTDLCYSLAEGSTGQSDAEQARFLGMALRSLIDRTYAVSVFSLRQSGTFLFPSFSIFALPSAKMENRHDKVPCCRRRNLTQSRPPRNFCH